MADTRCPMCGKVNPDDREECQYCGARLVPLIIEAPPEEEGELGSGGAAAESAAWERGSGGAAAESAAWERGSGDEDVARERGSGRSTGARKRLGRGWRPWFRRVRATQFLVSIRPKKAYSTSELRLINGRWEIIRC
jgi:hypothetical protein